MKNLIQEWEDYFYWCNENNRKINDGATLIEYVRGVLKCK